GRASAGSRRRPRPAPPRPVKPPHRRYSGETDFDLSNTERPEGVTVKRRESMLALVLGVLVVLGALTLFASELSDTQAKSKADVKARVHERGVLAAALIDSLFQT